MPKRPLSDVADLPYYGHPFPFIPWTTVSKLRVSWVFARHLAREVGIGSFLGFWLAFPFRLPAARRESGEGISMMRRRFGVLAGAEWALLMVIYRVLERREGKQAAYAFAREAIQDASGFMMADFYQADALADFEDSFEAFWAYHKAMFSDDPNYPNEMIEEKDLRVMTVSSCANCAIARLSIPELAPLGCDHDIAGYKAIEDRTNAVFRRPVTLAKDGQPCRFMFFRKGTPIDPALETH